MNNNEKRLVAQAIFETLFSSGQGFAIQREGETISAIISSEAAIDDEGDNIIGSIDCDLNNLTIESQIQRNTAAEKIAEQLKENLKRAAFVSGMSEAILKQARTKQAEQEPQREATMH